MPMSHVGRVAWKDGMFLLPQHFQQAERSWDALLHLRLAAYGSLAWGVLSLQLDESALSEGRLSILSCRAVMPDGLALHVPDVDAAPPSCPLPAAVHQKALDVYLTVPERREGIPAISEGQQRADSRFTEKTIHAPDDYDPTRRQDIEVAAANVRIAITGQPMEGLVLLKIAELERNTSGAWIQKPGYIPPCPNIGASPVLMRMLSELVGAIGARAEGLKAERRGRDSEVLEFNPVDILGFWFLYTLNQQLYQLRHLTEISSIHPALVYGELWRLLGALSVFSPNEPPEYLPYDHILLDHCFHTVNRSLRELLSQLFRTRYITIPLTQDRSSWDGRIADRDLLERGQFFLAAKGALSPNDILQMANACKVADSGRLESVVRLSNPGLSIEFAARPPSPVPVRADSTYFKIKTEGPLWQEIKDSGHVGIYVPRQFERVSLELICVFRQGNDR